MNHSIKVGQQYVINVGIAVDVLCVGRYEVFVRVIDTNENPNHVNTVSDGREYTIPLLQAINDWKLISKTKDKSK